MVVEKVHGGESFEDVRNCQIRPRSTTTVKKLSLKLMQAGAMYVSNGVSTHAS